MDVSCENLETIMTASRRNINVNCSKKHIPAIPLQWRPNGCDGVSNYLRLDCLLSRLFRRRSKKTSKLRWLVNSQHKRPIMRKLFPFEDVMILICFLTAWYRYRPVTRYIDICINVAIWQFHIRTSPTEYENCHLLATTSTAIDREWNSSVDWINHSSRDLVLVLENYILVFIHIRVQQPCWFDWRRHTMSIFQNAIKWISNVSDSPNLLYFWHFRCHLTELRRYHLDLFHILDPILSWIIAILVIVDYI